MNPRARPGVDPVELAINGVLEAERAAQRGIARARDDAQARLAAARAQARLIAERGERRLGLARQCIEARISARETQVDGGIQVLRADATPPSSESERIDRAVGAIAAALTPAGTS
jgi:hypothetical protein